MTDQICSQDLNYVRIICKHNSVLSVALTNYGRNLSTEIQKTQHAEQWFHAPGLTVRYRLANTIDAERKRCQWWDSKTPQILYMFHQIHVSMLANDVRLSSKLGSEIWMQAL
ncbi:hypothetical protein PTI98_001921 [Pleurotus ostreatus]|nr:hypothetical protein PTI98_001921 [Pleurotus ostreatus]